MKNLFNFKKKKDGVIINNVQPLKPFNSEEFNMWCKETGATTGYIKFKTFEDPTLVPDAIEFDEHLKKEIIISQQQKFSNQIS